MKALWIRYAERINAATLRERAMIFAAAALVLIAAVNAALIEPMFARGKRLESEMAQRQSESVAMQAQLQKAVQGQQADPDAEARKRLAELQGRIAKLNAEIAAEQKRLTTPERMQEVLEQMLLRQKVLRVVDMKTLPLLALNDAAENSGRRIYRHGIELTVSGAYLDLLAYVRSLEGLPSQIYWGSAELNATAYPNVELRLTVYTLSFEKSWMQV